MHKAASPESSQATARPSGKDRPAVEGHASAGVPLFLQGALPVPVQAKLRVGRAGDRFEEEADTVAQRTDTTAAPTAASPPSPRGLSAESAPLNDTVRQRVEPLLSADLGGVRVHSGPEAERAAASMNASAFTHANHIFLGGGRSQDDIALLAHEATHVVQQGGAPSTGTVQRVGIGDGALIQREVLQRPDLFGEGVYSRAFYLVLREAFAVALGTVDRDTFRQGFLQKVDELGETYSDDAGRAAMKTRATALLDQTVKAKSTTPLGAYELLGGLASLDHQAGNDTLAGPRSLSTELAIRMLAEDAATDVLAAIDPTASWPLSSNLSNFTLTLEFLRDAISEPERRYQLELEGTVVALVEAREDFQARPDEQETIGARIGALARRALLLNAAIEGLRLGQDAAPAELLGQKVLDANARIAAIRAEATSERDTRKALGDEASLLSPKALDTSAFSYAPLIGMPMEVAPEVALPETTDRATIGMAEQARNRATALQQETEELRRQVVPDPPRYTLEEFGEVFRRWFGFFSPERERRDPMLLMLMSLFDREAMYRIHGLDKLPTEKERKEAFEKLKTPYELTGIPSGISSFSGGAARVFMLEIFVPMIERQLKGAGADFAEEITALPASRTLEASGSAGAPSLDFSAGFDVVDASGRRRLGAEAAGQARRADLAARFSSVARAPSPDPGGNAADLIRLLGPRANKLSNPNATIYGLRETSANEGWNYLVDVHDPTSGEVVARERRVVPPEVARYLLAQEQLRTMMAQPLIPRAASDRSGAPGPVIGDRPTRQHGLERAGATSVAEQLGRKAQRPDALERDVATLGTVRGTTQPARNATLTLIRQLEAYLDEFFKSRPAEYRFAGVLMIGNAEHGIGRDVKEAFSPEHLLKVSAYAYAVSFGTAVLDALGPIGQIVSAGIKGYMQANNCSPAAAIAGVFTFLRRVSEVTNLRSARTWGYLSRPFIADISSLTDELFTRAATKAAHATFNAITTSRPTTASGLLNTLGEIARDPAAQKAMLTHIEAELSRLGKAGQHGSPEYKILEAMQVEVGGAARRGPPPDPAVKAKLNEILRPTSRADDIARVIGAAPPRTADERAELQAAIPADLRDRVKIVENPMLSGKTTFVKPTPGEVQIHVGPGARPADITSHIPTAREQLRVTGPLQRVQNLIARVTGRKQQVTRGREAELELDKLDRMLQDLEARKAWLEENAAGLGAAHRAADAQARAEVDRTIESIVYQMEVHAHNLGSMEPGRGFIAAVDAKATVTAALVRTGTDPTDAKQIVKDVDARRLAAVADLVTAGTFYRLVNAGVSPAKIITMLGTPDGYQRLITADLDPGSANARQVLGAVPAGALARERASAAQADLTSSPAQRLAKEWGVNSKGEFQKETTFGAQKLTIKDVERLAREKNPPSEALPRIVYRRWRYIQRVGDKAKSFDQWAEHGFQANVNRDASSPFEAAAIAARGGFLNNESLASGGQRTHDYGEWVTDRGRFLKSYEETKRRPTDADDYYEVTTRPDGTRPRRDKGFDVIEHKHVTSDDGVLHDSIQLRAQREMAQKNGGQYELVLTSDKKLSGTPPMPPVEPSSSVGAQGRVFFFDGKTGTITHEWSTKRVPPGWKTFTGD